MQATAPVPGELWRCQLWRGVRTLRPADPRVGVSFCQLPRYHQLFIPLPNQALTSMVSPSSFSLRQFAPAVALATTCSRWSAPKADGRCSITRIPPIRWRYKYCVLRKARAVLATRDSVTLGRQGSISPYLLPCRSLQLCVQAHGLHFERTTLQPSTAIL